MNARIRILLVLAVLLVGASSALAWEHDGYVDRHRHHYGDHHLSDISLDVERGDVLVLEHHRSDETLEFTPDGRVFLDGDEIELDADSRKAARRYHRLGLKICERAEEIGEMGAALGGYASLVAVKAITKAFAEFGDDDGDLDRLERISIDEDEFERLGDEIEEEAEAIEEWADEMEEIAEDLCDSSRELRRVRWFRP